MPEITNKTDALPSDDLSRVLALTQVDSTAAQHTGMVGNTYTITVAGKDTENRFCVIDMHVPPGGGPGPVETCAALENRVSPVALRQIASTAYVTGQTKSIGFPVTEGAFQTVRNRGSACGKDGDAFLVKMKPLTGTKTAVTSSPDPSVKGQLVTFAAAVSSVAGAPPDGETVSFMNGKTILGTGTLTGGLATFATSTLKVGTNSVTGVYGGDSNFAGSTSLVVKQVVDK
jgi:hypothetical protein